MTTKSRSEHVHRYILEPFMEDAKGECACGATRQFKPVLNFRDVPVSPQAARKAYEEGRLR